VGTKERRERERMERRRAILDAARVLVRERGFNRTTTRMIAEACELSEATLFFYFSSKDEILTSLLLEGAEFMADGLERIVAGTRTTQEKLRRVWEFFATVQKEHPEYIHVSSYIAHPEATGAVDPAVRDQLGKVSGENFDRLTVLMTEVIGEDRARVGADVLWGTFLGLSLLRDARINLDLPPHPDRDELAVALDLLVTGVATGTAGDTV